MSREVTNSDIKKKGDKFHAVVDWRDGSEGGTERETFDTFDAANAWISKLEEESDSAEVPAASGDYKPATPLPGEDTSNRGDMSHSPSAEGFTAKAVPTASDADTLPEPAASDMNPADAENINSNINLAPSTVLAGDNAIASPDPFSNPLNEPTAADTQPAPSDHNVSNEVSGVQDANAKPTSSAQQPEEQGSNTESKSSSDNTNTASKTKSN